MNWIIFGLVFFLVVIDWMIGRQTIKRCEAEMVNALKYAAGIRNIGIEAIESIWDKKMAEVDEKLKEYDAKVINDEENLVPEWQKYIRKTAEEAVRRHIVEMHVPMAPSKPAEVKLTLDFKGIKR